MRLKITFAAIKLILILAIFADIFGQSSLSGTNFGVRSRVSDPNALNFSGTSAIPASPAAALPFQLQAGIILPNDNSINADEYLIGSGDVFFATVVELPAMKYTIAVDQSGRALIQNVGMVDIGKITYTNAKKIIAESISAILRNPSEIYVTLIQTKNATVSFTGQVYFTGSHEFPGTTRLLDAITAANNGTMPAVSNADLRQVQLTNGDSTTVYDLLAYLHKGDKTQNPYIYPGDQVRINPTTASVFISGAIITPVTGRYPLKKGETLREFLSMFTMDNTADTNNIVVFQTAGNSQKTISLSEADYVLNNLDAITIPVQRNRPDIFTVSITGEIASPGHYPIVENSTSARQLIEMAGGPKTTANMDLAIVARPFRNLPERFANSAPPLSLVRQESGVGASMAWATQDYSIIRLVFYNSDQIILEPGDQVVIPKRDNFVYVSGSVKNPGAYPFLHGKDVHHYVARAGGFSSNADRSNIRVLVKYGDFVQSVEPRCVEAGSVIVVPPAVQYKFLSQVLLPLITTALTTVGVGISIYTLTR